MGASLSTRASMTGEKGTASPEEMVRSISVRASYVATMHPRLSFKALLQLVRSTFSSSTKPERIVF